MAVLNPSFEEPGVEPGQADNWTESYDAGAEDVAAFAHYDFYTRPWDDFEQSWWDNHYYQLAFVTADLIGALFDGDVKQKEDFETGWRLPATGVGAYNHSSLFVFQSGWFALALFDAGADEDEDFESGWGVAPYNEAWEATFDAANFTEAAFDTTPETHENFEEEWKDNENYDADGFAAGIDPNLTAAEFDGGGGAVLYEEFTTAGSLWTTTLP